MFVAPDASSACTIALELGALFANEAALPSLRSGVDLGEVLSLDGDYYGPIVNRAARLVDLAPANGVLVSGAVRDVLDLGSERLAVGAAQELSLKGFDELQLADPVANQTT
jgi:adenylate cyclase